MNTKNFKVIALLAVLLIGVVLISGCVQQPEEPAPVTTKPNVTAPPGERPPERPQADPKPNVTAPPGERPPERPQADPKPNVTAQPGERPPERPQADPKPNVTAQPGERPPERPPAERHVTDETLSEILGRKVGIFSVKYDEVITVPGEPSITQKWWLKKNKTRIEMRAEGRTLVYIVNMDTKTAYMYMPEENVAMKINPGEVPESYIEHITYERIKMYMPVIVGTDIIDGKICVVIEYVAEGVKTKVWLWEEKGFPIRMELLTPRGEVIVEYKNIEFVDIPNSMFELPPEVAYTRSAE